MSFSSIDAFKTTSLSFLLIDYKVLSVIFFEFILFWCCNCWFYKFIYFSKVEKFRAVPKLLFPPCSLSGTPIIYMIDLFIHLYFFNLFISVLHRILPLIYIQFHWLFPINLLLILKPLSEFFLEILYFSALKFPLVLLYYLFHCRDFPSFIHFKRVFLYFVEYI